MNWFFLALACSIFEALKDVWSKLLVQKADEYFVAWALYTSGAFFLLPINLFVGIPQIEPGFFIIALTGSSLNVIAIFFYMKALRHSELSLCMPFLTFTPVFMLATGPVMLGELPSALGIVGILSIVCGAYVLNLNKTNASLLGPFIALMRLPGPRLMLTVAFIWSFSAPIDKLGVVHSGPFFWLLALNCCMSLLMLPIVLRRMGREIFPAIRKYQKLIFVMGCSQTIAHCTQMLALKLTFVAFVVSIKRLNAIWSVLFGHFVFRETNVRSRVVGAAIMVAGVVLIAFS